MDFKLDDNNDLIIENNNLVLIDGIDLVRQLLLERLRTFRGEWFLDVTVGVPYFQDIMKKGVNINSVSSILKDEIVGTPGVISLKSFELDFDNLIRELKVVFSAQATQGEILINEVII